MIMASVRELLDDLAAGRLTPQAVAADFERRRWAPRRQPSTAQAWGVADDEPPGEDEWAVVEADSRLSPSRRELLGRAYDRAHARHSRS